MDEKEALEIALPVVKKVVNWLSAKQYKKLPDLIVLDDEWTPALVKKMLEEHLKLNEFRSVDPFGTPLKETIVNYEYKQMSIIPYKDGSGFHLDYELTSKGGEWNDLTLQLSFEKDADGKVVPHFKDLHVTAMRRIIWLWYWIGKVNIRCFMEVSQKSPAISSGQL